MAKGEYPIPNEEEDHEVACIPKNGDRLYHGNVPPIDPAHIFELSLIQTQRTYDLHVLPWKEIEGAQYEQHLW